MINAFITGDREKVYFASNITGEISKFHDWIKTVMDKYVKLQFEDEWFSVELGLNTLTAAYCLNVFRQTKGKFHIVYHETLECFLNSINPTPKPKKGIIPPGSRSPFTDAEPRVSYVETFG